MDSKLLKAAVLSSLAVILLVSVLVLYTNGDRESGSGPGGASTAPPQSGTSGETGENGTAGGQIGND